MNDFFISYQVAPRQEDSSDDDADDDDEENNAENTSKKTDNIRDAYANDDDDYIL